MKDATKVFAMNWRFFPTLDPQVNVYHCRDLDSRFSQREVAAVQEFMASGMGSLGVVNSKKFQQILVQMLLMNQGFFLLPQSGAAQWPQTSKMHPVCAAPNLIRLKYPLKFVLSGIKSWEKCPWPSRVGHYFQNFMIIGAI